MKINNYFPCKSSFLSVEKDMQLIVDKIIKNERLKKLLYYNTKNPIEEPSLSQEQSLELFGDYIRIVPKIIPDGKVKNYIIISFDNFTENNSNPEFRDNIIEFDIICHIDQWQLKDFELRPYRIAAELDSIFSNEHLTGIGTLNFLGAQKIVLDSEYSGICLIYEAIHGEEDKKPLPNPLDQDQFNKDYSEMMEGIIEINGSKISIDDRN